MKHMDWTDIPTWASLIAVVISLGALWISALGLKWQRLGAETSARAVMLAEQQATDAAPPKIAWKIERPSKNEYVLRNIGTDTAKGVVVDGARAGMENARNLPCGVTVEGGGGSTGFLVIEVSQLPPPQEIWVSWDGAPRPVAVPVR